jgi:hypothetical protein
MLGARSPAEEFIIERRNLVRRPIIGAVTSEFANDHRPQALPERNPL